MATLSHRTASEGYRVLICAPYGRDAESVATLLRTNGYGSTLCASLDEVAGGIDGSTGAILVTEEALSTDLGTLNRALESQPSWSDVPFVLLAGRQPGRQFIAEAVRRRLPDSAINVILLERPLSSESLISAIGAAMRARQKQFEMRDRLAQLDAQQARLVTLLDSLPVGVAFINPDGSTLLSNPAFRRFLPTGEVPSRQQDGPAHWIGYEADGTRITRERFVVARALKGETTRGTEFRYHAPPDADVWTRVSGIPLMAPDDTVAGAIAVIVDIDEQKRAQEVLAGAAQALEQQVAQRTAQLEETLAQLRAEAQERERAQAALRQAQKMEAVGQLTGGIAHDFNNMLTGIIGAIDVMRRRIAANRMDDLDRFMEAAHVSAQRAAGLTQRLLAFSRRQSLDSRPTDINALVISLEDLLRRTMSERIDVRISIAADLPAALVDANQLESAILNLAINARDAMPDGGQLTVKTRTAVLDAADCAPHAVMTPGLYVVVTVSDTGVGMDTAVLEKVFDPFFTTKPVGQGTGLGLSMVYGFAEQSNGRVRIKSQLGAGTQVQIYLPAAGNAPMAESPVAGRVVVEGAGQAVLLVEDDASVRMLVRDVLEELGYVAVEAAEPYAAVQLLERGQRFDLMVSDVGLPGMNGRQLAEIARQHLPDIPILFITGYAENAAMRAGFLGTNMAMITKPFQIEDLSAKISEMLR